MYYVVDNNKIMKRGIENIDLGDPFLLRFLLLAYIICVIWKVSFFEGYLIAYIKLANRKRNVLVFPFCQNKNLQIWALFIVLEIKQIMSNICRWYVFLCKITFPRKIYFPMQKWENMLLRTSEGVMTPPVMSARASRH